MRCLKRLVSTCYARAGPDGCLFTEEVERSCSAGAAGGTRTCKSLARFFRQCRGERAEELSREDWAHRLGLPAQGGSRLHKGGPDAGHEGDGYGTQAGASFESRYRDRYSRQGGQDGPRGGDSWAGEKTGEVDAAHLEDMRQAAMQMERMLGAFFGHSALSPGAFPGSLFGEEARGNGTGRGLKGGVDGSLPPGFRPWPFQTSSGTGAAGRFAGRGEEI